MIGAVEVAAVNLIRKDYTFVSSGVIDLSKPQLGFSKGVLVRDPDGHVMALVGK